MELSLAWVAPVPVPTCGYKALYRANGQTAYVEVSTSGTTATINSIPPACYEGFVKSDFCSGNTATGVAFGINAYQPFYVDITINESAEAVINITSDYAGPYDLLVSGSFVATANQQSNTYYFNDITYPAGSTDYSEILGGSYPGSPVISDITVTDFSPVFNEGQQLQQLDPINTPEYFEFYWDEVLPDAWDGSPLSLPSFTLNQFTATDIDTSGNTIAGTLNFSFIISELYDTPPSTLVELIITDDNYNSSSTFVSIAEVGLVTGTINMAVTGTVQQTRQISAYWLDTTLIDQRYFRLPVIS
jgi:hypothetical protein